MPVAQPPCAEPAGETSLGTELIALASLLYRGSAESQASYREGVKWLPAGVLMEQLAADITLVYSLPKVGSMTIAATLNGHPAVRPEALHLHYLSPKGLTNLENQIAGCSHPNVRFFQEHLVQARGVRTLLAANRALRASGLDPVVRKPYLIAGVREPMALHLSLLFEGWWLVADRPDDLDAESLRPRILDGTLCRYCDDWFADELGAVFGLDVYARPFPTERGWDIYENDAARALVIRQENLGSLPEALGALYGVEPATFAVATCNVAEDKAYAAHYNTVKRSFRLTPGELDKVYAARSVRHFYSQQEIAGFRGRWSSERGAAGQPPPAAPKTHKTQSPAPQPSSAPAHKPDDAANHVWVCRPCWRCQQQLASLPGLQHTCAEQTAYIGVLEEARRVAERERIEHAKQLEEARRIAQEAAAQSANPLRALGRRVLPRSVRSLARRMLGGGRPAPRG